MIQRVGKFDKVSLTQYKAALELQNVESEYQIIKCPKRATMGSAGYDFFSPIAFKLSTNMGYPQTIKLPTGIRVFLDDNKVLQCYPRSGHGFKYRLQLDNTVGVIDSDYVWSDNEGHIFAKLTIDAKENKVISINKGDGFMQGIITKFYLVEDDECFEVRNGGFGSTAN